MDDKYISKLHSLARAYCIERYSFLVEKYDILRKNGKDKKEDNCHYSNEALNTFPRYNVLNAILNEIEKFIPEDFNSFDSAKELLKLTGGCADDRFTKDSDNETEKSAIIDERKQFIDYIEKLTEDDLEKAEILFYRRVLTRNESIEIWENVKEKWNIRTGYWFPLDGGDRDDVLAVEDYYFEEEFGFEKLKEILKKRDVIKVYEFREANLNRLCDLDIIDPYYNIEGEGYFFTDKNDWLVYVSHENSVTIAGDWLISEVKNNWNNWDQRLWKGCF